MNCHNQIRSSTRSVGTGRTASFASPTGRSDHALRRNQPIAVVVIALRVYASTPAGSRSRGQAT